MGERGRASLSFVRLSLILALSGIFFLSAVQNSLIPSWYAPSRYVSALLLLAHAAAVILLIVRVARRRTWKWPWRVMASLGLLMLPVAAALAAWNGMSREGSFMCTRELGETYECPGGGQVFTFASMCIAGNPTTEFAVRPGVLPFMYLSSERSADGACAEARR